MEKEKIILELPPILVSNEGRNYKSGKFKWKQKTQTNIGISVAGKHNTIYFNFPALASYFSFISSIYRLYIIISLITLNN